MGPTRIVLIRHGESASNAGGWLSGQDTCGGLTDLGVTQAEALRDRLAVDPAMRPDRVVVSTMRRAVHTAITEISDLPLLWSTIEISKAQLDRCRHMMVPRAGQAEATLEQHREIIRGLNSRDPAKAAAAMKAHLDAAYRSTVAVLDGPGILTPPGAAVSGNTRRRNAWHQLRQP